MPDPHAAFMRAQREYDNRMPPEAPDPCLRHEWDGDDVCPQCLADEDDWREAAEEGRRERMRE